MAKVDVEPVALEEEDELGVDIPSEIIGRSPGQIFWRRFRKDKFAFAGIVIIILIVAMALMAPLFSKWLHHPADQSYVEDMTHTLAGNSSSGQLLVTGIVNGPTLHNPAGIFLFGGDSTARDLFVRVMYGAQTSLVVALSATVLEVVLGVFFGILAGFYRGKVDTLISRMCDVFFALPTLLLILGISAACGAQPPGQECLGGLLKPGRGLIIFLIGFFSWPYLARIIRGQVLSLREKEFVEAARSLGASNTRIMVRDILPNVLAPIIVYSTLLIPTNILAEASLSFLGLGVPPSIPSWGNQISEATSIYRIAWWTMVFPGIFLLLTTLAFNLVGDGLRDAFDPKTA
jgi:peptide/nickel transport system permease protein